MTEEEKQEFYKCNISREQFELDRWKSKYNALAGGFEMRVSFINRKSVEEMIFDEKFKNEEYNPNDFNDWAKENEGEAYAICLKIAKQFQKYVKEGNI